MHPVSSPFHRLAREAVVTRALHTSLMAGRQTFIGDAGSSPAKDIPKVHGAWAMTDVLVLLPPGIRAGENPAKQIATCVSI